MKGTLLEGAGAPGAGTGGGLLAPGPTVVPGVVEKLFQPIQVTDLFATVPTTTNTVRYAIEGTAVSGAAGVAQGGDRSPKAPWTSTVDEPVKKIATAITVSGRANRGRRCGARVRRRQALASSSGLRRSGSSCVALAATASPGLVGRAGVNTYARGTIDNNAVAIAKVIGNTAGSLVRAADGHRRCILSTG